jgi:hypothetical protein
LVYFLWLVAGVDAVAQESTGLVASARLPSDLLSPAEVQLKDRLTSSLPMIFDGGQSQRAGLLISEQRPEENRRVRATVLQSILWGLASDKAAMASASPKQISGAVVEGPLDLSYLRADFALIFENCVFPGGIRLAGSRISELRLIGSVVSGGIDARAIVVNQGGIWIERCEVGTGFDLRSAKIQGDLHIINSKFQGLGGVGMAMDGFEIDGSVHILNGSSFQGEVRMLGAQVRGGLRCLHTTITSGTDDALSADVASIGGDVQLREGFRAVGTVRFQGAKILGELDCSGVIIERRNSYALLAEGAELAGGLLLRGNTKFIGEVDIVGSRLSRISLVDVQFEMPGGKAFAADGIRVTGSVLTHSNVIINGECRFVGAEIQGDLALNGASLRGGAGSELLMQRAVVAGDLMMSWDSTYAVRVNATGVRVLGSVSIGGSFRGINNFIAIRDLAGRDYALNLSGARVEGDVRFDGGTYINGAALFKRSYIGGCLDWSGVVAKQMTGLDLGHATLGQFEDSGLGRPPHGLLHVDGLSYQAIKRIGEPYRNRDDSVGDRLSWLDLVHASERMPGPYEELARYYSRIGWDDAFDTVMIRKNYVVRWPSLSLWDKMLFWPVDFGYRPFKAFVGAIIVWGLLVCLNLFGMWKGFVFWIFNGSSGYELGSPWRMVVKAVLYSVDLSVPIDLGLRSSASLDGPAWFLLTQLLMRFVGWLGVTLFIAGLTGLIKV